MQQQRVYAPIQVFVMDPFELVQAHDAPGRPERSTGTPNVARFDNESGAPPYGTPPCLWGATVQDSCFDTQVR